MTFKITSPAFADGTEIPRLYTCQGDDISPPLNWENPPQGTRSFALIVDDPDAPDPQAPRMVYVHWVVYDLPATTLGLEENIAALPRGAHDGLNDWKRTGYGGPCPPIGRHRYFFKLYALDKQLGRLGELSKSALLSAMQGHVLAEAVLMGTYKK